MKKLFALFLCLILTVSFFACSKNGGSDKIAVDDPVGTPPDAYSLTSGEIIISGAGEQTVLVNTDTFGLVSLNLKDTVVTVGNAAASFSDLKNGMKVDFICGDLLETYPSMASPSALNAWADEDGYNDICGMYTAVIKEIWEADSGLNAGENVYLDLSKRQGDG